MWERDVGVAAAARLCTDRTGLAQLVGVAPVRGVAPRCLMCSSPGVGQYRGRPPGMPMYDKRVVPSHDGTTEFINNLFT